MFLCHSGKKFIYFSLTFRPSFSLKVNNNTREFAWGVQITHFHKTELKAKSGKKNYKEMLQIETLKKTLEKEKSIETHTRKTKTKSRNKTIY
jgi:hypothetical protein